MRYYVESEALRFTILFVKVVQYNPGYVPRVRRRGWREVQSPTNEE